MNKNVDNIKDILQYTIDLNRFRWTYEELLIDLNYYKHMYKDIKKRIDKAIEYCEKELNDGRSLENQWLMGCYDTCKELLDILKGNDNND